MNPREPRSHHVSAPTPVNLRTARLDSDALRPLPLPPGSLALSRHRKNAARALLGMPLTERIQAARPAQRPSASQSPARPIHVGLALLTAASGSGVVIGALQASWPWVVAGAVGLLAVAGIGAVALWRRRSLQTTTMQATTPQAFDVETLRRLDDLLETIAPELPAEPCAQLVDLKDRITRIAELLERVAANEHVASDDRMYLVEAVRRYLPDTLRAYLAVPPAQQKDRLLDGGTAAQLLAGQLTLLQSELQLREDRLGAASGAALLRQQRFLQSKVGGGEG